MAFGVAALLCAVLPAAAQEVGPPPQLVDELTSRARDNLAQARLSDGSNVPAETPEQRAAAIVPRSLEVQTIDRALLSAALEACELDSSTLSYLPYMQRVRASGRYSERQIAYIGLLHGISFGYLSTQIGDLVCSQEMMADMQRAAASDPVETP